MNAWNNENSKTLALTESSAYTPSDDVTKKTDGILESYLVAIGSRSSRFRRRHKEKITTIFLLIIIFILLIVVIIIASCYAKEKAERKRVCYSEKCVKTAASLLMSMNVSANPCEDFYSYSCGNWEKEHPKPEYLLSFDWFSEKEKSLERKIRDVLTKSDRKTQPLPVVQAMDIYDGCLNTDKMNELGMKPVVDFMKSVNLPLLPSYMGKSNQTINGTTTPTTPTTPNSSFNWLDTIVRIKKKSSYDVLIGFDIMADTKNATVKRLVLQAPTASDFFPGYKELDRILNLAKNGKLGSFKPSTAQIVTVAKNKTGETEEEKYVLLKYKKLISHGAMEMISYLKNTTKMNVGEYEKNVDNCADEYISLYRLLFKDDDDKETKKDEDDDDDIEGSIVYYTVGELQNKTDEHLKGLKLPNIEVWKPYLMKIFENSSITLDFQRDIVMTTDADFKVLLDIVAVLQNTTSDKIELLVWFEMLENFFVHTTYSMRSAYEQYVKQIANTEGSSPRSIHCAKMVNGMMGMAVSYAAIDRDEAMTTLGKVSKMLDNIKTAFVDMLGTVVWMDPSTKQATIDKVSSMRALVGFPDWLYEPGQLESYYEGLVVANDTHVDNIMSSLGRFFTNMLKRYRRPYAFGWDTNPMEVNAYHTFQANGITVPLAMLQFPFYDLGLEALNYGSVGTILGHEITHGFDDTGRRYDKNGNLAQWWTNATVKKFVDKTKCFIDQYSEFYVKEADDYVDGKHTLGENIADNGGLTSALKGYWLEGEPKKTLPGLTHLSGDQLFFLAYGNLWCGVKSKKSIKYDLKDEHSPSFLRAKGVLQNTPEFAAAFDCPTNTTMNPSKERCRIF